MLTNTRDRSRKRCPPIGDQDAGRRKSLLQSVSRPWWKRHGEILRYAFAFVAYVGLGVVAKEVFSSWVWGLTFLVVAVWGLPALWRRLR